VERQALAYGHHADGRLADATQTAARGPQPDRTVTVLIQRVYRRHGDPLGLPVADAIHVPAPILNPHVVVAIRHEHGVAMPDRQAVARNVAPNSIGAGLDESRGGGRDPDVSAPVGRDAAD